MGSPSDSPPDSDYCTTESHESLTGDAAPVGQRLVPALTILFHRDPRRIGKRALLRELSAGREVGLSRITPRFAEVGNPADAGEPLSDPRLSRQLLRISPLPAGGLRLCPLSEKSRLRYRGAELVGTHDVSGSEILDGGVLELGGSAALVLHLSQATPITDEERFALVGRSHQMQEVRAELKRIARLDAPTLIRGETGCGKELVARALHATSPRAERPFIAVNLGALPPSLAAAELFGAERGAFTGAEGRLQGYFQQARGGTLFLDEIGEAPPEVQVMLLRAIETGEFRSLGGGAPQKLHARIIAATDADLDALIRDKAFRAPLLHRLSACEIRLPPLRKRREDIGQLVLHFLRLECTEQGQPFLLDRPDVETAPWLPLLLLARLCSYDWPGNVRQLRNVIRQMVLASAQAVSLQLPRALADDLFAAAETNRGSSPTSPLALAAPPRRRPAEIKEAELLDALERNRWDLKAAAETLAIARPSLYMLLERFPQLRGSSSLTVEELRECYRNCAGDLDAMTKVLHISHSALRRRLHELRLR
jgi:DNA-binding NtrC family response regulator